MSPLRAFLSRLSELVSKLGAKRPPVRNIAASADAGDTLVKEEVIVTKGPLKDHHLRLAIRDPRLLPKRKTTTRRYPRPPKPKYLTRQEANWLFGPTLRTRNRNVMDIATDEEQLRRYGLPVWTSGNDLADALGLPLKQLQAFCIYRRRDRAPHYITFAIAKRSGGERLICAPKRRLKALLRKLNALLVAKLPVSEHAHGFMAGRSIATNARPHVGKRFVLRFDIKDCFPSIHFGRVRGLLLALGYSYPVAGTLAALMTESPRQPVVAEGQTYHVPIGPRVCVQGAPTSPGLCNAVLLRMDRRLAGLARASGFTYTRYADDLTFSGNDKKAMDRVLNAIPGIVSSEGFAINAKKTRVMRAGQRQTVTGVVVNQSLGLSRQERRKLRAALHQMRVNPTQVSAGEKRRIEGKLAYLRMLNPDQARRLQFG